HRFWLYGRSAGEAEAISPSSCHAATISEPPGASFRYISAGGHPGDARWSEQRMCPQDVPIVSYAPTAQSKGGLF
ncbi:MAG: hypothetical protein WBZ35_02870, partial [Pseudolabrys sp.]